MKVIFLFYEVKNEGIFDFRAFNTNNSFNKTNKVKVFNFFKCEVSEKYCGLIEN